VSRFLLTGATGFIGWNAIAPLAAAGLEVHAVTSREPPAGAPSAVTWHTADLLAPGAGEALVGEVAPSRLLHLAWYAEPGKYWRSPENVRWVEASLSLLRSFADAGGERAVLAGTCAEYDWSHGFLSEGVSPLAPATLYGRSKHALREVGEAFAAESGLSLAWGRVFFLYGPREDPRRLVSSLARALLRGEEAPTTEGSQVRDFMHVQDVAGAFCALLASGVEGAVNIGSGVPVSVRQVTDAVASATGRPELVRAGALPQREGEPPLIVADARRLREEVGFAPGYDLPGGVEQTVEWWRGHL
jgi:nucleoside-diphosphate-sugar epimerase